MTHTFNLHRLWLLLLRTTAMQYKIWLIGIGGILGFQFIISILAAQFGPEKMGNIGYLFLSTFFWTGFAVTGNSYTELYSSNKGYAFLTLPASSLEKTIVPWMLSGPIFAFIYFLLSSAIYGIALMQAGRMELLADYQSRFLEILPIYLVTQPIFFLGACTFRNWHFLRTLLSMCLLIMLIALFCGLVFLVLFQGTELHQQNISTSFNFDSYSAIGNVLHNIFQISFPLFLLVVSYFKIKERQV